MHSEEIVARLLHRDALMLVIDKPAGLPVHPGPGGGETLSAHLDALRFGLPRRPEIVHRLDKDTAGCLVLGRHAKALARLGALFRGGEVEKVYWAVVQGGPQEEWGEIDMRLGPVSPRRPWLMRVDPDGQEALTRWRLLARGAGATAGLALLELRPATGRTHQLRVHCAQSGWPILGDRLYGEGRGDLQLLARALTIPLHPGKPPVHVEAPVPSHMRRQVEALLAPGASR